MDIYQNAEQLKQIPLFSCCDSRQLKLLAFTGEALHFRPSEYLFKTGEVSDAVYVILSGEVTILRDDVVNQPLVIGTARQNELIGEMAVFLDSPRIVTAQAENDVQSLKIANQRFIELITENPSVALDVMRQLSIKILTSNDLATSLQAQLSRKKL